MSKSKNKTKNQIKQSSNNAPDLQRGTIKSCFVAALVTSKIYKMQVVKAKKGKGSYRRKGKNKAQECYLMAA